MGKELMGLIVFGFLFIFGLFTYIPFSEDASLTNNPFGIENIYSVDSNWSSEGTLTSMETDGDILYTGGNTDGEWLGTIQKEASSRTIKFEGAGDPRDGDVAFYIQSWQDLPNGNAPDNVYQVNLNDLSVKENFTAEQYNYFNVRIEINETSGSNNQRPNVDSFSLTLIDESDQLGMSSEDFEVFTLFTLLGFGLIALIRWI